MSTRPEEKEAEEYAELHYPDDTAHDRGIAYLGYLAGATAEAKKAVELRERLKAAEAVIERMIAMAGHPDAAEGCRNLIGVGKTFLARFPQKGGE